MRSDADNANRAEGRPAIYKAHVMSRKQWRQRLLRDKTRAAREARVAGESDLPSGQMLHSNAARTRQEHLFTL